MEVVGVIAVGELQETIPIINRIELIVKTAGEIFSDPVEIREFCRHLFSFWPDMPYPSWK